jgi:hypothetical protein
VLLPGGRNWQLIYPNYLQKPFNTITPQDYYKQEKIKSTFKMSSKMQLGFQSPITKVKLITKVK